MYNNNNSSNNAENEKPDSWSFSFDYQRFSNKNKPKSLLGRRTLGQTFPQQSENVKKNDEKCISSNGRPTIPDRTPLKLHNLNGPSLTHPVNPNVTPINKFPQPSFNSHLSFSKNDVLPKENNGKSCQRGLGFSTPFKLMECPASSSCNNKLKLGDGKAKTDVNSDKQVIKDLSSDFVSSNMFNRDLNTSFICEDTYPLPGDNSITNEADQRVKLPVVDKTTEMSQTENVNNSCFMTAHEIHPPDLNSFKCNEFNFKTPRRHQDSITSKTPGRNFTLFSISQSPIDPLAGILNEDNESFCSDNSISPLQENNELNDNKTNADMTGPSSASLSVQSKEIIQTTNEKPFSPFEDKHHSLPFENFISQDQLTQIKTDPDRNNDQRIHVNNESKPVSETHETKASCRELSIVDSSKGMNTCTSSNTKDLPAIIINRPKQNLNLQSQPLQVPIDPFTNSKLVIKPQPQNILYINNKPYAALSLLGRGGSSEVYQVLEENSSRLLAIKCVNLAAVEDSTANGYLNEIELLSKLQGCPSVIRMFDHEYIESTKMLYVVMEKGDIDLSRLIKDITKIKKIPMSMIIYYWTEMLSAVKDIHDKGVIHSDLKPGNFLLVCGRLKLIDFGIASSLQGDMTSVEKDVIRGTFNYISPEAICAGENRFHKINYKSDVWSLGCILYNLLFGCTPFSHIISTLGKFQAIADPNYKIKFPKQCSNVPPALMLSLRWCLLKDSKSRPTVDRLLKLSEHAIRVPQIDKLWFQYVIKEFPDCSVSFEELGD